VSDPRSRPRDGAVAGVERVQDSGRAESVDAVAAKRWRRARTGAGRSTPRTGPDRVSPDGSPVDAVAGDDLVVAALLLGVEQVAVDGEGRPARSDRAGATARRAATWTSRFRSARRERRCCARSAKPGPCCRSSCSSSRAFRSRPPRATDPSHGEREARPVRHLRRRHPDAPGAPHRARRQGLPDGRGGARAGRAGAYARREGQPPDRRRPRGAAGGRRGGGRVRGGRGRGEPVRRRQRRRVQLVLGGPRLRGVRHRRRVPDVDRRRPAQRPHPGADPRGAGGAPGPLRAAARQRRHRVVARGGRAWPVRRPGVAGDRRALPARLHRRGADLPQPLQQLQAHRGRPTTT
jgi:hypothetical protein